MTDRDAIIAANTHRRTAMINADRNQLEAALLARLVWSHPLGVVKLRGA